MQFIIHTDKKEYSSFNGFECKVVNDKRTDGLIEVYVPVFNVFILLEPTELEDE